MLARIVGAVLSGAAVWFVFLVIGIILGMISLGQIGDLFTKFAWIFGVLVGLATFLGVLPNYWSKWIN
jgi:uncharacterized membrane protein